jgi:peroxiredoxin
MNTTQINTEILPFKATAFHNGQFVEITDATLKGKWSVVFFYPADFTFVCPTELGDMADLYPAFCKTWAWRSTRCPPTPTSRTRPGTTPRRPSARSATR